MKKCLILLLSPLLLTFSSSLLAQESALIKPQHSLDSVSVESVKLASKPAHHGGKEWFVTATATAPNACAVPKSDELYTMNELRDGKKIITVASFVDRICTSEYNPVSFTLDLGSFTNFGIAVKSIVVNGVEIAVE